LFYITVILIANIIIAEANAIAGAHFGRALFESALATASVFAIDGIFAFLIRRLPERYFNADRSIFVVSKKEARFYRRLKINKWKKYVPELGGFTAFHKDKLQSASDSEYLARFILESNYGVAIHLANMVTGILLFLLPFCNTPSIAIPVASVNAVLSLLPVMILRANTPALQLLYKKSIKK
jgi:hypothetical protein